jgi:BlaI family transcriptional regulator, penicillinase repressor
MGELERAVLDQLWSGDPERLLTVREVHDALAARRDIAYTTVMTVLDRLAKKGLVVQERDGRAYLYRAAASRSALTAELMREALEELSPESSGTDRHSALVAFVGESTSQERAALRAALAALDADPPADG